jgi:hypothetical protein
MTITQSHTISIWDLTGKDEEGSAFGVDFEFFFCHLPQSGDGFAHVAGVEADPNLDV